MRVFCKPIQYYVESKDKIFQLAVGAPVVVLIASIGPALSSEAENHLLRWVLLWIATTSIYIMIAGIVVEIAGCTSLVIRSVGSFLCLTFVLVLIILLVILIGIVSNVIFRAG